MTIMPSVASAVAVSDAAVHPPIERPNRTAVGTIVWLSSELMFFAALFAIYYTLRATSPDLWAERTVLLNIPFASVNTTILVLSSVTCQLGVLAAERGQVGRLGSPWQVGKWGLREWFVLTYVMGAVFVAGQVYEYSMLWSEGVTLSADPYSSIFYMATGIHAMHVTGGLVAFLFVLGRTFLARRFTHEQATSAIVVSYYWHFVDVVWIGLFFTIYVVQ